MGCDIHSYAEVKKEGKWEVVGEVFPMDDFEQEFHLNYHKEKKTHKIHPFDWRSYGMFGFLADVRNYSYVPVIAEPKYGIPEDASDFVRNLYEGDSDWHTATWLTLKQLFDFNYDQVFWDRRVTKQVATNVWDGAATAEEGEHVTLREFLGPRFFRDLEILKSLGKPEDVRVIFWFDN